jgi:hypothetical protein
LHQSGTATHDDVVQLWERLKWSLIVGDLKAFAVVPGYGMQEIGAGDWAAVTSVGPPGQMLWRSMADRIDVCPLLRDEDIPCVSRLWIELKTGADVQPPVAEVQNSAVPDVKFGEPQTIIAESKGRRGAKPQYDWLQFKRWAIGILQDEGGLAPANGSSFKQSDLERMMIDRCGKEWEKLPAESTIRVHVRAAIEQWDKEGRKADNSHG